MIADIGIGDIVRHYKGNLYKILAFGKHTETGEQEVIYQALYPPFSVWVRPYDMFMDRIDDEKQKYRFEALTQSDLMKLACEERALL